MEMISNSTPRLAAPSDVEILDFDRIRCGREVARVFANCKRRAICQDLMEQDQEVKDR